MQLAGGAWQSMHLLKGEKRLKPRTASGVSGIEQQAIVVISQPISQPRVICA